jgi:hypothetical protein
MKIKKFKDFKFKNKKGKVKIRKLSGDGSVWTPISNTNSPAPRYQVNIKKVSEL